MIKEAKFCPFCQCEAIDYDKDGVPFCLCCGARGPCWAKFPWQFALSPIQAWDHRVREIDDEVIAMIFMQIYSRLPSEEEVRFAKDHYKTVRETRDILRDMKK